MCTATGILLDVLSLSAVCFSIISCNKKENRMSCVCVFILKYNGKWKVNRNLFLHSVVPLLRDSIGILMQRTPPTLDHTLPECYQRVSSASFHFLKEMAMLGKCRTGWQALNPSRIRTAARFRLPAGLSGSV